MRSGEGSWKKDNFSTTFARITAEIAADRDALLSQRSVIESALARALWSEADPVLSQVALAIHHWYCAAEMIFERIARAFEGLPDRTERYHAQMLRNMTMPVHGVREAVIGRETFSRSRELLAFRHFLRHAYAVALDPTRLRVLAENLIRADDALREDLDRFLERLQTATEPDSNP